MHDCEIYNYILEEGYSDDLVLVKTRWCYKWYNIEYKFKLALV